MNQAQTRKILKSVLLLLCLYQVGLSQRNKSNDYRLVHSMTYDGKNLLSDKVELLVIDSFAFEGIYTNVSRNTSNLQPNGKMAVDKSTIVNKDSLTKYAVTDFKSEKCFVFSLSNPPKLIQTVPLSAKEKVTGILFKKEMYVEIGNIAKNFKHVTDTVIGVYKYQILENTTSFSIQGIQYQKAKVFLSTGLQYLPFHPISTQIDNQFGGIATRIELFGSDGKAFITDYTIEAISKGKVAFVNRYLNLLPR